MYVYPDTYACVFAHETKVSHEVFTDVCECTHAMKISYEMFTKVCIHMHHCDTFLKSMTKIYTQTKDFPPYKFYHRNFFGFRVTSPLSVQFTKLNLQFSNQVNPLVKVTKKVSTM